MSRGRSRMPMTPVAPARKIRIRGDASRSCCDLALSRITLVARSAGFRSDNLPAAPLIRGESMPAKATKKATAIALERERLEGQLRQRADELELEREYIRTVVNNTSALFSLLDANLRIVRYNDAFETLLGIQGQIARGELFCDAFVAPGEATEVRRRLLSDEQGC